MPVWLSVVSWVFTALGFVAKAEQMVINWKNAESQKKADDAAYLKVTQDAKAREESVVMPALEDVKKRLDDGTA